MTDPRFDDGDVLGPNPKPDDPGFVHRLGWRTQARTPMDWDEFLDSLAAERRQYEAPVCFADSSLFDRRTDERMWQM